MRVKKSDRDAVIVILLVALVAVIVFPLLGDKSEGTPNRFFESKGYSHKDKKQQYFAQPEGKGPENFPFDPNTADSTTLLRLGLKPWQVRNIYKYRAKGGRYRHKEDFARLYGLTLEDYRRLEPYIQIRQEVMAADVIKQYDDGYDGSTTRGAKGDNPQPSSLNPHPSSLNPQPSKLRQDDPPVDINTADTTELKRIPGVGSYFARRIVELRYRRQAFLDPEELLSIRNFPETALVYMKASQNFAKVHVNRATLQQLRAHPLINYTQAADIIKYRRTNGVIRSEKDISFLPSFTKDQLKRLAPYLIFD